MVSILKLLSSIQSKYYSHITVWLNRGCWARSST